MPETTFTSYHNGELVPADEAVVPIDDAGFQWGHNVYDLLVTVEHEPYDLEAHVERTLASCRAANIPLELDGDDLAGVVREVVDANAGELEATEDLMVTISVSGGWDVYAGEPEAPRLIVSVRSIPYARFARDFVEGRRFVTTSTRQLPTETLSPLIKHRSRMHFVLADIEAKRVHPRADPLLLDADGNVTETAIGNVFCVTDGVVRTPPLEGVLPGVTREVTLELAREALGLETAVEPLQPYDLYTADEVFWTNTSHVVVPVVDVDGRTVGDGEPGDLTMALLGAHGERAGVDILERALGHLEAADRVGAEPAADGA